MDRVSSPSTHPMSGRYAPPVDLSGYAWLSIGAAIVTIALKAGAYLLTGSVGLLSDAAESLVNLVAAIVALCALKVAIKPPDKNHQFGHSKAEYFSAGVEGTMIFVAAAFILATGVERLIHPHPLENLGWGLAVSVVASLINGGVALILLRRGRAHRSATLVADGKHLMTDVVTSGGVLAGVGLVAITGQTWLDPIVAIGVGVNILFTGTKLLAESTKGLMDVSLPKEDNTRIRDILARFCNDHIQVHALRTRESGNRRFMEYHLLVPGAWSVQQAHDFEETIVKALLDDFPDLRVTAHLEPIEDPVSYEDVLI